jgi:DNA-directed RNA polymerase specialized sigma24 family protein
MARSSSMRRREHEGGVPMHTLMASRCLDGLPEWGTIWGSCARRFRAWRTPPRWSVDDWSEEMQAQGVAVAWQALRDYDPARGVPLSAFVLRRVLFGVRARHRQEWAYAVHCGCVPPADGGASPSDAASSTPNAYEALQGPLARLAEPDRRLIEHLFWGGRTEADVAGELGISQPAVSQRKRAIILVLRRSFASLEKEIEEFYL